MTNFLCLLFAIANSYICVYPSLMCIVFDLTNLLYKPLLFVSMPMSFYFRFNSLSRGFQIYFWIYCILCRLLNCIISSVVHCVRLQTVFSA